MATPDETLIINYLTDLFSWNGTTMGQPLTITFSFISTLPSYYDIDAIKATTDGKNKAARDFVSLLDPSDPTDANDFSGFTQGQLTAADLAIKAWVKVANITFNDAGANNPNAVITLGNVNFVNATYAATAGMGYTLAEGQNNYYGDIWINSSGTTGNINKNQTAPGEDGYQTILHELGHALGLSHPNDNGYFLNQLLTTMSYNVMDGLTGNGHDPHKITLDGTPNGSQWYPAKPMLYDILDP